MAGASKIRFKLKEDVFEITREELIDKIEKGETPDSFEIYTPKISAYKFYNKNDILKYFKNEIAGPGYVQNVTNNHLNISKSSLESPSRSEDCDNRQNIGDSEVSEALKKDHLKEISNIILNDLNESNKVSNIRIDEVIEKINGLQENLENSAKAIESKAKAIRLIQIDELEELFLKSSDSIKANFSEVEKRTKNIKLIGEKIIGGVNKNLWFSAGAIILLILISIGGFYHLSNTIQNKQNKLENNLELVNSGFDSVKKQLSTDSQMIGLISSKLSLIEKKINAKGSEDFLPKVDLDESKIKTIVKDIFDSNINKIFNKEKQESIDANLNNLKQAVDRLEKKPAPTFALNDEFLKPFVKKIDESLDSKISKLKASPVVQDVPLGNPQDKHAVLVWISISRQGINPTKEFVDKLMKSLADRAISQIPKEVWLIAGPNIQARPKQFSMPGLEIPDWKQLNADKNSENVGDPEKIVAETEAAFKTNQAINKKRKLVIMASDEAKAPKIEGELLDFWKSFDAIEVILVHARNPYEGSLDQRREISKWNVWAANQTNAKVRVLFSSLKPKDNVYQAFQPGDKLLNSFFELLKESMLY